MTLEQRYALYNMYIAKAAEYFGVTKTRDIYEQAINALPQERSTEMCQRYANLERKLGEVAAEVAARAEGASRLATVEAEAAALREEVESLRKVEAM